MAERPTVRLFAYDTLRQREVQMATFGRELEGTPDVLPGYRLHHLTITDPDVVQRSGAAVHWIARQSGNRDDGIPGVVFLLTGDELAAADRYEVDAYARVEVTLGSGTQAFIYAGPSFSPA